jgi:DNA-binding CsgD family transcriptional regulator
VDVDSAALVGREDLLRVARSRQNEGGSVLFAGPAGIGKSAVLSALATEAAERGERVLRCVPVEADSRLPFLCLIDLLAPIGAEATAHLAEPQRTALDAALLRSARPAADQDRLAVRLAVLYLLRRLAVDGPVLLVVDDLQWVDAPSAEVLAFVARRVAGLPLRLVAAERVTEGAQSAHHDLCPPPVLELSMPPLPPGDLAELLRRHTGTSFLRRTVESIYAVSAGNPFFAVEIGRALLRRGTPLAPGEPLPVPSRLRSLMLDRLAGLSPSAHDTLLLASAAARPTWALLRRLGRAHVETDVANAAALGIADAGHDGIIRFTHPLLSATLYGDASTEHRRAAHAKLAAAAPDLVERARHLALATPDEDEDVAARLMEAAASARSRGAPAVAAELTLLAADRTPADSPERATERRLAAAEDALSAGQTAQARETAELVLATSREPRQRVGAWMVLLDAAGQAVRRMTSYTEQALRDAGDDPALQAPIRRQLAAATLVEGRPEAAAAEAARAAELAAQAGDSRTQVLALSLQATVDLMTASPRTSSTLARALEVPQEPATAPIHNGPRHLRARFNLFADRLEEAREELESVAVFAEEHGNVEDLLGVLLTLVEVEVRAGRCRPALDAANRGLGLVADAGLSRGPMLFAAGLAEASGGSLSRARRHAEQGVRDSEADRDQIFLMRNLYVLGHAALVAGDAVAAIEPFRQVQRIERNMGIVEPALIRWHADFAEALVAVGALDEAAEVVAETHARASRLGRTAIVASLARVDALRRVAVGEQTEAAADLRALIRQPATTAVPLEHGRALLALGVVERRCRRRAAARDALQAATAVFERAEALPWQERVHGELLRAGVPSADALYGAPASLTETERRVAQLVAGGATNREVAATLFISVKTVEANLTRIYQKLRVRSRTELVSAMWVNALES